MTRVFVVDDHALFRDGLRLLVDAQPDMEMIGEAEDAQTALAEVESAMPDVIVLDTDIPRAGHAGTDVTDLARALLARVPSAKIVALSPTLDARRVEEVIRAGAGGFVLKSGSRDEVVKAIREVQHDHTFLCPEAATALVEVWKQRGSGEAAPEPPRLSAREREVLVLLAEGLRTRAIAARLGVGHKTVATHRSRIMKKTMCASTADLIRYAIREGLTPP